MSAPYNALPSPLKGEFRGRASFIYLKYFYVVFYQNLLNEFLTPPSGGWGQGSFFTI